MESEVEEFNALTYNVHSFLKVDERLELILQELEAQKWDTSIFPKHGGNTFENRLSLNMVTAGLAAGNAEEFAYC